MAQTHTSWHDAFFYGTLMAPSVLHRVTRRPHDQPFSVSPAILAGYRRHRVKDADYPAVVPTDPNGDYSVVRGTYVQGLTDTDMLALDIFEGDEYERRNVTVELLNDEPELSPKDLVKYSEDESEILAHAAPRNEPLPTSFASEGGQSEKQRSAKTQVYVWIRGGSYLEETEWDFAEFIQERLHMWAPTSSEYKDVDDAFATLANDLNTDPQAGNSPGSQLTRCDGKDRSRCLNSTDWPKNGIGWRSDDPTGGRSLASLQFEAQPTSRS